MADENPLSLEQELAYWLERLKDLDDVLAQPVRTLIEIAEPNFEKKREGVIPAWISETAEPAERSLLVDALCCATLQRFSRVNRRFAWFTRRDAARLAALQPKIADRMTELGTSSSKTLLRDPVFGVLSPLTAAEVLWTLLNAAENRAFGATGFATLVSMFWSLLASYSGDARARDARALPAAITARWLLPLQELQVAIRKRAVLYRAIRAVMRELEQFRTRENDPHFRWKFACTADRLAGLILDLSDFAVNREEMEKAAEAISKITRELQAIDASVPWPEIHKAVVELVTGIRKANLPRLKSAHRILKGLKKDLLRALQDPDDPWLLYTDVRPRRAGEKPEQYRERVRASAEKAIERCLEGLDCLYRSIRVCNNVQRDTRLDRALKSLAVANEEMDEVIESIAGPAAERCREIVRQEVAFASAGNDTEFDATELLSAAVIAERWKTISDLEIDDAVAKALLAQRPDGSWNTGKPVFREKHVLGLWPNTADAASLLATVIRARPRIRRADDALMRFVGWLERNRTEFDRHLGQTNDDEPRKSHLVGWSTEARDAKTIDLWTTAASIGALLDIREIIEYRLWQLCERRFVVLKSLKQLDEVDPVDLGATHGHRLHYRFRASARRSRSKEYREAEYSFVLHGPPGSSKTALAEALGSELWRDGESHSRVVRITPADFTRQGEAGVDAEARFIFALLSHVRRATIIFDEIDDLLRRREMKGPPAFLKMIVPAMLNRLQDLRDAAARQEICYIIAMNYVDNIEPALVRPGRVDAVIPIVYPDPWSRENTLHRVIADRPKAEPFDDRVRARIIDSTAGWPWATFHRLCQKIVGKPLLDVERDIDDLRTEVQSAAYVDADRWKPVSPALVNEVAHFAFAFARSERECKAEIHRLLTESAPKRAATATFDEASADVVSRVGAEWKREGRAEYSQPTALRTAAMGMTLFPEDDVAVFRVWAPGTQKVDVERPVDNTRVTTALAEEGEDIWAGEASHVRVGDRYRYSFTSASSELPLRRADPYGRDIDDRRYTVIAEPPLPSLPPTLGGWHDLVIYQIHPRSFSARKSYAGVAARMSDLEMRGINAIELLNAGEYPLETERRWDDTLYDAMIDIERSYGTVADLHDLVDEAHRQQVAVLVGMANPTLLGRAIANLHNFTGVNVYLRPRDETELSPRPDVTARQVVDLMTENALRWVREIGVDGLRWAGTNFIRSRSTTSTQLDEWKDGWQAMRRINEAVAGLKHGTLTIAQDVIEHPRLVTHEAGCAGFGAQWTYEFEQAVWSVLTARASPDLNLLKQAFERRGKDAFRRVVFAESHDTLRRRGRTLRKAIEVAGFEPKDALQRTFLGMALVLSAPGIPLLLQGQELCEASLTQPPEWSATGSLRRFDDLIACRRNRHGKTPGLMGHFVSCLQGKRSDDIFIVTRWDKTIEDAVVVIFNFGAKARDDYPVHFPRPGTWHVRFNPAAPTYGDDFEMHDSYSVRVGGNSLGNVSIGAHSVIMLSHAALGS